MPTLPTASFDLVFTSPPYNLGGEPWPHLGNWKHGDGGSGSKSKWKNGSDACGGINYGCHSDDMAHLEYVSWQKRMLRECWRLISDDGAIFYNHKPRIIGGKCWLPLELNPDLPMRQILVWARAGGMNYNPTAYVPTHEWIMIFAKQAWRLRDRSASGVGDVWRIAQESNNSHPAPFPIELPAAAIETTGCTNILDPFSGSGTTLRAAKDAGIMATGIEQEERWCEHTAKRLEQNILPMFKPAPKAVQRSLFPK